MKGTINAANVIYTTQRHVTYIHTQALLTETPDFGSSYNYCKCGRRNESNPEIESGHWASLIDPSSGF